MPAKKKPKDKNEKGDKKKKEKVITGPPEPAPIDNTRKEWYLIQIRELEERVNLYKKKCDELEQKNNEQNDALIKSQEDQKDVILYIRTKLDNKIEEISELEASIKKLDEDLETEMQTFDRQFFDLQMEHQRKKDDMTSELTTLTTKLKSLEEFEANQDNLKCKLKELELKLFQLEAEHRDAKYQLEKQHVVEKDRLKKEMVVRLNALGEQYRKSTDDQISETTWRTMEENVTINHRLVELSTKSMELLTENEKLKQLTIDQKRHLEMLEDNHKQITRRNVCNQKVLTFLKDKCMEQSKDMLIMNVMPQETFEDLHKEKKILQEELKQTEGLMQQILKKNEAFDLQKGFLISGIEEKKKFRSELYPLIIETATVLENLIKPKSSEDCDESVIDISSKRERILNNLLTMLNLANKMKASSYYISNNTSKVNAETLLRELPEYVTGYIGLVPIAGINKYTLEVGTEQEKCKKTRSVSASNKKYKKHAVPTAHSLNIAKQLIGNWADSDMFEKKIAPSKYSMLPMISSSRYEKSNY